MPRLRPEPRESHPDEQATARVPAKINLQLSVGARRRDGYHDLVTVFQAVSLYDDVIATPAQGVGVTADGEGAGAIPLDSANLAVRAARLLADFAGVPADVHLHLAKTIPVAGGMAGGSADAAGALIACDRLWGLDLEPDQLAEIAAGLGADVPFGLVGGTAVGVGTGTSLTPALAAGRFHWVLAFADTGLATAEVYAAFDRLTQDQIRPEPRLSEELMSALRAGDPVRLGEAVENDLQPAAISLRPSLRRLLDAGADAGALGGVVSGSGPTCAFLARDEDHATDLAVALSATGLSRSVRRVHGPVGGARVIAPENA